MNARWSDPARGLHRVAGGASCTASGYTTRPASERAVVHGDGAKEFGTHPLEAALHEGPDVRSSSAVISSSGSSRARCAASLASVLT